MFQINCLENYKGKDFIHSIDQGQLYHSLEQVVIEIAKKLTIPSTKITIEEV